MSYRMRSIKALHPPRGFERTRDHTFVLWGSRATAEGAARLYRRRLALPSQRARQRRCINAPPLGRFRASGRRGAGARIRGEAKAGGAPLGARSSVSWRAVVQLILCRVGVAAIGNAAVIASTDRVAASAQNRSCALPVPNCRADAAARGRTGRAPPPYPLRNTRRSDGDVCVRRRTVVPA
jgi:hypothetical protein